MNGLFRIQPARVTTQQEELAKLTQDIASNRGQQYEEEFDEILFENPWTWENTLKRLEADLAADAESTFWEERERDDKT